MDALRAWTGSDLDVIMVGTWILCGHGWTLIWTLSWYALQEWMESDLDVIMVGTWILCGHGWRLIWTLSCLAHGCSAGMDGVRTGRYHGWHMDALRAWMKSDLDVIMVGTWMLCGNGWSPIWTLSWLAHGCSAGMDGVWSGRYHGWHMDALRAWMESDLDFIMVGTHGWGTWTASETDAGQTDGVGVRRNVWFEGSTHSYFALGDAPGRR
eukprot:s177_g10.t1